MTTPEMNKLMEDSYEEIESLVEASEKADQE